MALDFPKSRVGNKLVDIYRLKKEIDTKNILHTKLNNSRKKVKEGLQKKKEEILINF